MKFSDTQKELPVFGKCFPVPLEGNLPGDGVWRLIVSLTRRLRIVFEAYQRPPTPLSVLTLRKRLLLPKVRAFVDFLQQHWMHPRPLL
jgi:DNA-binding transcriptional LysR family regulator